MESVAHPAALAARSGRTGGLPWTLYAAVLGSTSIVAGLLWDISWHSTIGRDTFWTPAHMAIYLGGVLAGIAAGYLAIKTTFAGTPEERAAAVRFWGFRAPLGAWVMVWGAIAMLTSAPFDDWWHNAYGLDVKIVSPPHSLLAAGMFAIQIGAMLLVVSLQNRTAAAERRRLSLLCVYTAGVLLVMASTFVMEYSDPNLQHGNLFYQISCGLYPLALLTANRASGLRWGATAAAAAYTAIKLALLWILPLFPARPLLAPIYNPVTHMWPTTFPLLLILPAIALDLLCRRFPPSPRRDWLLAPLAAAVFLAVFLAAQWSFAHFMLSHWARNWFFAADQWWYEARPGGWRYVFWNQETDALSPRGLAVALLLGTIAARLGLGRGAWMSRVKR
ncbi:MAG TPA: hypothetical protein VIH93_10730 [Thermoanaerobaculia bacterium]|jgi:hypothetical protein